MISSVSVVTNRMDESEGISARSHSHFLLHTVRLSEKQQSPTSSHWANAHTHFSSDSRPIHSQAFWMKGKLFTEEHFGAGYYRGQSFLVTATSVEEKHKPVWETRMVYITYCSFWKKVSSDTSQTHGQESNDSEVCQGVWRNPFFPDGLWLAWMCAFSLLFLFILFFFF